LIITLLLGLDVISKELRVEPPPPWRLGGVELLALSPLCSRTLSALSVFPEESILRVGDDDGIQL